MIQKVFLDSETLLLDSFRLGAMILNSGFIPTYMIAIWRGGTPVGVAVQEILQFHGVNTDHIAIRTSSYSGINKQSNKIAVHGLNYLVKNITHEDRLLVVDDVLDTGLTIQAILAELERKARLNTPSEIRVAVPYYKPSRNQTSITPDYFIHTTEAWLKFPHSLEGLSVEEIAEHRSDLNEILSQAIS